MQIQDKRAEVRASGEVLKRYDQNIWNKHLRFKVDNLKAAKLDILKNATILDFGCGPGTFGVILGKQNNAIGIDIARLAVEQARDRAKAFGSNFDVVEGDGEKICFRQSSFDVCFSGWAIHHLPSVKEVVSELQSLLKPNGLLVVIEPNEDSFGLRLSRFIEDRFRGMVLKSGLDTPNRTTHTNREYLEAIESCGFQDISTFTHYNKEKAELPNDLSKSKRFALKSMIEIRHVLLLFSAKVLGQGSEVFFIARKPS